MVRPRVAPLLLLQSGSLVKTIQFASQQYVGDPFNAVAIFNAKGVDEIVVLDIEDRVTGSFDSDLLRGIARVCTVPLTYGGKVQSTDQMSHLYQLGIEKIVINSAAHRNPRLIQEAASLFGSQAVSVGIDVRAEGGLFTVYSHGGTQIVSGDVIDIVTHFQDCGAGEIFVQSIDRDGMWSGFDLPLVRSVTAALHVPVMIAGGAGSFEDIRQAVSCGASAVAVGSMAVFQGQGKGVLINFPSRKELDTLQVI